MSVIQKMFVYSSLIVVVILVFTQAVPIPEEVHPEYRQHASAQVMNSEAEPVSVEVMDPAIRSVRSASPFFGILGGYSYEKPYKNQHHHNYHQQEREPEYHRPHYYHQEREPEYHRPHYHQQEHEPQHHYKPQQNHGGGAGSYASAGSFAGGQGGGHSQSSANSHSASFGFGPFQASYSASAAHSGSHSNNRELFDY